MQWLVLKSTTYDTSYLISGKVCNETDVQLVGSRQTPGEGEVQICLNGSWGSVCDSNWGYSEARVVCRQLGYDGCEFYFAKSFIIQNFFLSLCRRLFFLFHSDIFIILSFINWKKSPAREMRVF